MMMKKVIFQREKKNMVSNSMLPPIYTNVTNLSTKETSIYKVVMRLSRKPNIIQTQ